MDRAILTAIAVKEVRTGLRNRWFMLYAALFVVLSVAFSAAALGGAALAGQPGFGRTSAGLLNLMLLIVPLIGLTIGAQSLAAERDDRVLDYMLAQPVAAWQVYLGKYLGAATALLLTLGFGFGSAGLVMAWRGTAGGVGDFGLLIALTMLLGLAMLSVGYLVSSFSPRTAAALGIAVSVWLLFVVVGDLGLMGSALVMKLRPDTLLFLMLLNPLDVYKLVGVDLLHTSLDVLGPAGVYAVDQFGDALAGVLLGVLALWVVVPLPFGYWLFRRTDIR